MYIQVSVRVQTYMVRQYSYKREEFSLMNTSQGVTLRIGKGQKRKRKYMKEWRERGTNKKKGKEGP